MKKIKSSKTLGIIGIFFSIVAIFLLESCAKKDYQKTISVKNVLMEGTASDFLKVSDGDYVVKAEPYTSWGGDDCLSLEIYVKFEKTDKNISKDFRKKVEDFTYYKWKLMFLDKYSNQVDGLDALEIDWLNHDGDKISNLLKGIGNSVSIRFQGNAGKKEKVEQKLKEIYSFAIINADLKS